MDIIDQHIYSLFLKYGGECLWKSDSRVRRPKGTNEVTDEMFHILETVDHKFQMIYSGLYSNNLVINYLNDSKQIKTTLFYTSF